MSPQPDRNHPQPSKQSAVLGRASLFDVLLEAVGFATLYVVPFAASFLSASRGAAYHSLHPLSAIYRAILVVILLVWLFAVALFLAAARLRARAQRVFQILLFALLPWLACRALAGAFAAWTDSTLAFRIAPLVWIATLSLGLALLWRPRAFARALAFTHLGYRVAAFGMLVVLPRVAWHAWHPLPRESPRFVRANLPPVSPSEPRLIWLLMDELSYDQIFDHRQPTVALPNFDALAHRSVVFSQVRPAGDATEKVIPGLLLGKALVDMRKTGDGLLRYRTVHGGWQSFREQDTLFADAHAHGWTTGVAGWYNPYCRLLPNVLDRCFWQFSEPVSDDLARYLSSQHSVTDNVIAMMPLRHALASLLHRSFADRTPPHRRDYEAVMTEAGALIADTRIRMIFVHLNVPHPAGIYNRARQAMSDRGGSYLDNLALADKSLGALESAIRATPAAADTTLIVSSDHSWRTYLWRGGSAWTNEDERATRGGRFDRRPVLIVRLPEGIANNESGVFVSRPVGELAVHALIEAALRGRLGTAAEVTAVAASQPVSAEPASTQK